MTDDTNIDNPLTPLQEALRADPVPPSEPAPAAPLTLQPETFQASRAGLQTGLIAVIFLVLGFLGGIILMNSRAGMSPDDVRTMINDTLAESGIGTRSTTLMDDDPSFGPEDAPVTIVEFSDFFCTFCTRFATETLPRLQERYGDSIRFVYRDMPIIAGQASVDAAIAGNCAHDQGKFWEFHNLLFANNSARARENFIAFAGEVGMDTDQFDVCLDDPVHMDEITLDVIDGQTEGVEATPKFFVNNKIISGAQPYDTFVIIIDAELEKAGVTPPAAPEPTPPTEG